jgi:hypothetical protein
MQIFNHQHALHTHAPVAIGAESGRFCRTLVPLLLDAMQIPEPVRQAASLLQNLLVTVLLQGELVL